MLKVFRIVRIDFVNTSVSEGAIILAAIFNTFLGIVLVKASGFLFIHFFQQVRPSPVTWESYRAQRNIVTSQ